MIEQTLAKVFPGWARKRAEHRLALTAAAVRLSAFNRLDSGFGWRGGRTAFDAASRTRIDDEIPSLFSADGALLPEFYALLARARHAKRNNWAVRSAADAYRRHIVGTGITCRAAVRDPVSGDELADLNARIDALWTAWATDPRACDLAGKRAFVAFQALAVEEWFTAGEAFIVHGVGPDGSFVLDCVEPEQLARDHEIPRIQNEVRGGVELNSVGRPVAYWIHVGTHPLEGIAGKPTRIPSDNVCHFFLPERARQTRGVTRLAPVLADLKHLYSYDISQIVRARMEAMIGLLITRDDTGGGSGAYGGVIPGTGAAGKDAAGNDFYEMEPGMVQRLRPGESVTGFDPKAPGNTYEPFVRFKLRQIAAGLGLDYPTLARDFTNGSFSSQREGHIERDIEMGAIQSLLIATVVTPIRKAFINWAVASGRLRVPAWFTREQNAHLAYAANVQPPAKAWIDPSKQAAAARMAIQDGLSSLQIEANTLGMDWRELLSQRAEARDYAASLGVTLPFDETSSPGKPGEPRPTYGTEPGDNGEPRGTALSSNNGRFL